ncbi:MAG: hypothetical protein U1F58_08495 [Burkholderiales bacterium]
MPRDRISIPLPRRKVPWSGSLPAIHPDSRQASNSLHGRSAWRDHATDRRKWIGLLCATCLATIGWIGAALAGTSLNHMRAAHMEGNWTGNIAGIKRAGPKLLEGAASIAISQAQVDVEQVVFVDARGATITSDIARVKLTGVAVGGAAAYTQAGFWVSRHLGTGDAFIQFRPSADPALANVPGFSKDVTFAIFSAGTDVDLTDLTSVSEPARTYVLAVLAHGAALLDAPATSINVKPPSAFDRAAIQSAFNIAFERIQAGLDDYFAWLRDENIEWIGISVAMFYDSVSDPNVRLRYRPSGDRGGTTYTFDDIDLENFIVAARKNGLKIYLTLAFEPATIAVSTGDPQCLTPQFKPRRGELGAPSDVPSAASFKCIASGDWWWNPTHPKHAANVAQFWGTYTDVAVKYAKIAQRLGVEMYSLGTETENLFRTRPAAPPYTNHFKDELTALVGAVRSEYSGLLTYDQDSYVLMYPERYGGGAGSASLFGDLGLDVVGISAYFSLLDSNPGVVVPVASLEVAWKSVFDRYLVPLQTANPQRPIVFTEMGFTDDVATVTNPQANAGVAEPQRDATGSTPGMRQQSNVLEAFFNVDEQYGNLVRGAFLWGTMTFRDAPWLCDTIYFNIYCKAAAEVVRSVYGGWRAIEWMPAVEYYHAAFDHYFVTSLAEEMAKLDSGVFKGWARTGESFNVFRFRDAGRSDVCRFFSTAFSPKSSHFYTPSDIECGIVKQNPNWQFEAVVFALPTADAAGQCPTGTHSVYRLYNNGQGAAPNHRYTTNPATRAEMLAKGWLPEGNGPLGVIMCAAAN